MPVTGARNFFSIFRTPSRVSPASSPATSSVQPPAPSHPSLRATICRWRSLLDDVPAMPRKSESSSSRLMWAFCRMAWRSATKASPTCRGSFVTPGSVTMSSASSFALQPWGLGGCGTPSSRLSTLRTSCPSRGSPSMTARACFMRIRRLASGITTTGLRSARRTDSYEGLPAGARIPSRRLRRWAAAAATPWTSP